MAVAFRQPACSNPLQTKKEIHLRFTSGRWPRFAQGAVGFVRGLPRGAGERSGLLRPRRVAAEAMRTNSHETASRAFSRTLIKHMHPRPRSDPGRQQPSDTIKKGRSEESEIWVIMAPPAASPASTERRRVPSPPSTRPAPSPRGKYLLGAFVITKFILC